MSKPTDEALAVSEATGKQVSIWAPSRQGGRLAMIVLTLGSTLEDGTEVQHETWAVGITVQTALRDWIRQHVKLAQLVKARRVVTSGLPVDRPKTDREIVGSRVVQRRRIR